MNVAEGPIFKRGFFNRLRSFQRQGTKMFAPPETVDAA